MEPVDRTAAALIIGNELLTGKIQEQNLAPLARTLRGLGVHLRRVVMVEDHVGTIADEVRALAAGHDWLFTSGGVGPTHDDVTVEAVAAAFGVPVVRSQEMESMLRAHYGARGVAVTDAHLRLALMPEGATQEVTSEIRWPTIRMRNVWVMPGIPEVFAMKLPVVAHHVGLGRPFVSRAVYTLMDEGELKPLLDSVVSEFPDIDVGSYPKWMDVRYKTKITFDGRDQERVDTACARFVEGLPNGELVDPPS